jgi:iron complex outermembrane receptor protein
MSAQHTSLFRSFASIALGSTILVPLAAAQDNPASEPTFEEITVTARKRTEALQDVPMSISAVTGADLAKSGYEGLHNISRVTPNVYFEAADRTRPLIFVRGIGTRGYDAGSDPSVGVFVDGVYQGRFGGLDMDLLDVKRIEVLKGPQGTLYGRNTIGGALSVLTSDPSDVFEGQFTASTGFGETDGDWLAGANASVSGPLGAEGRILYRLSGSLKRREGYQEILNQSERGGSEDSQAVRGTLLFNFSEDATLRITADYSHLDGPPLILVSNYLAPLQRGPGPLAPGYALPPQADPYRLLSDQDDIHIKKDSYGFAATLDWDLGGVDLTSISSWRGLEIDELNDLDGTALPFQVNRVKEKSEQVSQELRLSGEGDTFNWLFGVYAGRETVDRVDAIGFLPASLLQFLVGPAPMTWDFGVDLESVSYAAFGQFQWDFSENWSLTVGARYSRDEKDVVFDTTTTHPGFIITPFTSNQSRSWESFDPSVSLRYEISDDEIVYASWASGYKSGAFQFIATSPAVASQIADPESVNSFEIGYKGTLLDKRLRLNVAAFHMDYKDLQQLRLVPGPVAGTSFIVIDNAASSKIDGIEIETKTLLGEYWNVDFSYAWLDAQYDNYPFRPGQDFSGNRMPRSPEHTVNAGLGYTRDFDTGSLDARISYSWRSKIYFEADNNAVDPDSSEDPLGLLDASLSWAQDDWQFTLWGTNLTDERYRRQVLNSTGSAQRGVWAEPRTIGLKVTYAFGAAQ